MTARRRRRLARMFGRAHAMPDSLARCMALTWCYAVLAEDMGWL